MVTNCQLQRELKRWDFVNISIDILTDRTVSSPIGQNQLCVEVGVGSSNLPRCARDLNHL